MKLLPALALFASLLAAMPANAQQTVPQMLTEAQTAYMRGELDVAKRKFLTVMQSDPKNQVAIGFLRRIAADQANAPKGNSMEQQLAAVVIPEVKFQQATLGAALEHLRQTVTKVSDGKMSVNFVLQAPAETSVTLALSKVPFTEVLRYLGELASVQFIYDKYAIIVKPRARAAAAQ